MVAIVAECFSSVLHNPFLVGNRITRNVSLAVRGHTNMKRGSSVPSSVLKRATEEGISVATSMVIRWM